MHTRLHHRFWTQVILLYANPIGFCGVENRVKILLLFVYLNNTKTKQNKKGFQSHRSIDPHENSFKII